MIDAETEIFSEISTVLRETYSSIFVTGEYVSSPSSFPCVSIVEEDNQVWKNTRDSSNDEVHVQVIYEVNVYSNKTSGKKSQCKEILALIDSEMQDMGFTRTSSGPVANEDDTSIYRMNARYRALIGISDGDFMIYRR